VAGSWGPPQTFDGPSGGLAVQVYEVSEETLKKIGIHYRAGVGLVDTDGNSWPKGKDWKAQYIPRTKQLILSADADFHKDIAALLLLVKRGYTELKIKR